MIASRVTVLGLNNFVVKVANALDRRRIAGRVSYDDYIRAGGRSQERMIAGIEARNDAFKRLHDIYEVAPSKPFEMGNMDKMSFGEMLKQKSKEIAHEALQEEMRKHPSLRTHVNEINNQRFTVPHASSTAVGSAKSFIIHPETKKELVPLLRSHEINEMRYAPKPHESATGKRTIMSSTHNSPRVITQEHQDLMRLPDRMGSDLRNARQSSFNAHEAYKYEQMSKGKFRFGEGLSELPSRKFWKGVHANIGDLSDDVSRAQQLGDEIAFSHPAVANVRARAAEETAAQLARKKGFWSGLKEFGRIIRRAATAAV